MEDIIRGESEPVTCNPIVRHMPVQRYTCSSSCASLPFPRNGVDDGFHLCVLGQVTRVRGSCIQKDSGKQSACRQREGKRWPIAGPEYLDRRWSGRWCRRTWTDKQTTVRTSHQSTDCSCDPRTHRSLLPNSQDIDSRRHFPCGLRVGH